MHRLMRYVLVGLVMTITGMALGQEEGTGEQTAIRVVTETIDFEVHYEFSRTVGPGRLRKHQEGVPGSVTRTYQVYFRNGQPVRQALLKEERVPPVPEIILMGQSGYPSSRGSFARSRVLTMEATAYDPSPETIGPRATGLTATGIRARFGVVAVDPTVIPFGTVLFVEGYGFAIAADRGSAIKGNKIDLCFETRREALAFGRRQVRVHILRNRD